MKPQLIKIDDSYYVKGQTCCFKCQRLIKFTFNIALVGQYIGVPLYCEKCDPLLKDLKPGRMMLQEIKED